MANPILPGAGQLLLQLNAQDVDAVMGNPTDGQIVREHNRFDQIKNAQKKGAGLDDNEFGGAIMGYNNVINIRSGFDLENNNVAIALQLAAIQQQLQGGFEGVNARMAAMEGRMGAMEGRMEAMEGRMGAMEGRMGATEGRTAAMEARTTADRARNYNKVHCYTPLQYDLRFRTLVKYNPGHPALQPPAGVARLDHPQQLIPFAQPHDGYPVGSNPPAGLMPQNYEEYRGMSELGHVDLRRALRAIHWFYNDPLLELTAHAGVGDTRARLTDLASFIMDQ
ncbi:hypothetical protein OROGR_018989 [Orobanche gracilis]